MTRAMTQNIAIAPMTYGGTARTQATRGGAQTHQHGSRSQHRRDEHDLPDLYADVEEEQRDRDRLRR